MMVYLWQKKGFERVVQDRTESLYVLERRGVDIRTVTFPQDVTFVFSDHLTMPKKRLSICAASVPGRFAWAPNVVCLSVYRAATQ